MARFGPRGRTETTGSIGIVLAVVAVVLLLVLSFRQGSNASDFTLVKIAEYKSRQQHLRVELKQCQSTLSKDGVAAQSQDAEVKDLMRKNKALDLENQKLVAESELLDKKSIECVEHAETQKHIWSQEDLQNAALIRRLEAQRAGLVANSTHLVKTKGMKSMLLEAGVLNLMKEHTALRAMLKLAPLTSSAEEYLETLLVKWQNKGVHNGTNAIMNVNSSEYRVTGRRRKTNVDYDWTREQTSAVRVFFQKRKNGAYNRPSWMGHVGNGKLKKGVHDTDYISQSSLPQQIRMLYDYALCAMGNNATSFVYPAYFKATPEADTIDNLQNLIETPLLGFCAQCRPQETTAEFKLACLGTATETTYGSIFFWRMRSRIRFLNTFLLAADTWMAEQGLAKSMGVRLRRGDWEQECTNSWQFGSPQLSYTRLLQRRSKEVSADFEGQCYPSIPQVIKTVNSVVAEHGFEKVYFSSNANEKDWDALRQGITVPIVRRETPDNDSTAIAIDIIIASKQKYLITNRFDLTGSQMVELFLLEHYLKSETAAKWITVW